MSKTTEYVLIFLAALAVFTLISVVHENDYEDQLISVHHKCTDHPRLVECQDYDPTEYKTYVMKKHGDYEE